MVGSRLLVALLLCGAMLALPSRQAFAWQTIVDDTPNANGEARDVATSPSGDVFAVGRVLDFTAVKLDGANGVELWRRTLLGTGPGTGEARATIAAANGDAIIAGAVPNNGTGDDFFVARLDGTDGSTVWRVDLDGTQSSDDSAFALASDPNGDVLAAGRLANTGPSGASWDFAVVKLAGDTGQELWRYERDGSANESESAIAVAVDPAGDIVAAGSFRNSGSGADLAVVKLSGDTGLEIWRREVDGSAGDADEALDLELDSSGNAFVAGFVTNSGTSRDLIVLKLSGANGVPFWSYQTDGDTSGNDQAVAVGIAGNKVFAAGRLTGSAGGADLAVVGLDETNGVELWTYLLDGARNDFDEARDLIVGSSGEPIVVGFTTGNQSNRDLVVARLNNDDGSERWLQVVNGSGDDNDEALSVGLVSGSDAVIVGGTLWRAAFPGLGIEKSREFLVLRIEGGDGTDMRMCSGRKLVFIDRSSPQDPHRLGISSRDRVHLTPPVRGSPGDPRTVADGGSGGGGLLILRNPTTGEVDQFPLPAENWKAVGTKKKPKGFRYFDKNLTDGPCRRVIFRKAKRFKAVCRGGGINFSLNEPSQGSLSALLSIGATPVDLCVEFGGSVLKDFPIGRSFGKFRALDAPRPLSCAAAGP